MGLSKSSTGVGALDRGLPRRGPGELLVALAGNPNVGKSTLFNALTGLEQHTGNWPGKTVSCAEGLCRGAERPIRLVDLPGAYSLLADSAEEEAARDFLLRGRPDAVLVVCDATCLERNLNLVFQLAELTPRVLVCVNLMDEARRKGVSIDLDRLSAGLGLPVLGVTARKKATLAALPHRLAALEMPRPKLPALPEAVEAAAEALLPALGEGERARWLALKLLEGEPRLLKELEAAGLLPPAEALAPAMSEVLSRLEAAGLRREELGDLHAAALLDRAAALCREAVTQAPGRDRLDRRLDRLLTGRALGYPLMLLLLALIFWLTISGANVPSQLLSSLFGRLEGLLTALFLRLGAPDWLHGALVLGVFRTLSWVVAVMLPPMAIFFPLFTLLEDAGYLPRVAYNLDKPFQRCGACGKQALCMAMGFGCNAAGVVGCRIISSPRERLLAVLTNSFVPCNGRFPTLIALLGGFFAVSTGSLGASALSALLLTGLILLAVAVSFGVTRLLSATVLKGLPSAFVLELPPYRAPQWGKVLLRSLLDRTLFVLGRAAAVAAPAGLVIWLLANLRLGEASLLALCAGFLDPFARLLGLDGMILLAFLLGFPANEIVLPILLMGYTAQGSLTELAGLDSLRSLLLANGWTWHTAASALLLTLFHWPCSTTLLTIRRETGSWRSTALAALLPTAVGFALCALLTVITGNR